MILESREQTLERLMREKLISATIQELRSAAYPVSRYPKEKSGNAYPGSSLFQHTIGSYPKQKRISVNNDVPKELRSVWLVSPYEVYSDAETPFSEEKPGLYLKLDLSYIAFLNLPKKEDIIPATIRDFTAIQQ